MFNLFGRFARLMPPVTFATASEAGLVRENNEDAFFVAEAKRAFAVADGMGGGECGELASAWVCEELRAAIKACRLKTELRTAAVEAGIRAANVRIREFAAKHHYRQMGSTVALLLFDPANTHRAAICHVGDTRVYRLRNGFCRLLTRDHTVGAELSRFTAGRAESAELGSRANPLSHLLTRAIGPELRVVPEWTKSSLEPNDVFLICSDGVHDLLADDEIGAFLEAAATPRDAIDAITDAVYAAGAHDNLTMICIRVGKR